MHRAHLLPLLCTLITACSSQTPPVVIDPASQRKVDEILSSHILPNGQIPIGNKIDIVSARLSGTPYAANTLIGSINTPEKLVVNINGVDCYTFIDYVNALSHASSKSDFFTQLKKTRYVNSDVDFLYRRHFFTDWAARYPANAKDVTPEISANYKKVTKYLNQKEDGSHYINGLDVRKRDINYIPGIAINQDVISQLKTGDYIGIYTNLAGLDVTHVGIFIMTDTGPVFRNASSLKINNKVVDSPFIEYMKGKPGIIVLRPLK